MFITLIRHGKETAAIVEYKDNRVLIETEDTRLKALLDQIYPEKISMVDFARANYRLNNLKSSGLSWELLLANEYHNSACGH